MRFRKSYFIVAIVILMIEIAIALFLDSGFIRHTFGDFLVVVMLYCFMRSFINLKAFYTALTVLAIAFSIEFLQLWNLLDYLDLRQNSLAVIILGSTFEITDLFAYCLGALTAFIIDLKTSSS